MDSRASVANNDATPLDQTHRAGGKRFLTDEEVIANA